jgi:hypothetical protein
MKTSLLSILPAVALATCVNTSKLRKRSRADYLLHGVLLTPISLQVYINMLERCRYGVDLSAPLDSGTASCAYPSRRLVVYFQESLTVHEESYLDASEATADIDPIFVCRHGVAGWGIIWVGKGRSQFQDGLTGFSLAHSCRIIRGWCSYGGSDSNAPGSVSALWGGGAAVSGRSLMQQACAVCTRICR